MKQLLALLVLLVAVSLTNGQVATVIGPENGLGWDDPNLTFEACQTGTPDVCHPVPCGWPEGYHLYYRLPPTSWIYGYEIPMYLSGWPAHGPMPNTRTNIVKYLEFAPGTEVCFALTAFNAAGESCMTGEVCVIWPYVCEYTGDRAAFIACVQAAP